MWNSVMTPFSLRDSNQKTACACSVRVSPHVCCQVYKGASLSQQHRRRCHRIMGPYQQYPKVPPSVSCHVSRCSTPSQHISPMMRPNELPRNQISINTPLGDDDCNACRLGGMSSPLTLVPGEQRIKTKLTTVTRDQSSRRRERKVAFHEP